MDPHIPSPPLAYSRVGDSLAHVGFFFNFLSRYRRRFEDGVLPTSFLHCNIQLRKFVESSRLVWSVNQIQFKEGKFSVSLDSPWGIKFEDIPR